MFSRLPRSPLRVLPLALALGVNLLVGPVLPLATSANHNAQLDIQKTPNAGTVTVGSPLTFTITLDNPTSGHAATANNVTVTDVLPAGFVWTENSPSCSVAADGRTMTCSIASIAATATNPEFTVTATSDASDANDCGAKPNTASVTYNAGGSTAQSSDSDNGQITVQCPALTITKTPDAGTATVGSSLSFAITVSNSSAAGTATASNVVISDVLPAGFTWTENSASCSIAADARTLSCAAGSLAPGASFSVTATSDAATAPADCGTHNNTAFTSADHHAQISNDGSITVACPDASVAKTTPDNSITPGEQARYDISVTAGGSGTSVDVNLSDPLPTGTWTATGDIDPWCDLGSDTNSNNGLTGSGTLVCDFNDLPQGTVRNITVISTTSATACGTLSNTASITSNGDTNSANNSTGSVDIAVACTPDVSVTKSAASSSVAVGDDAVYNITATAGGTGPSVNVQLTDDLPNDQTWSVTDGNAGNSLDDTAGCSVDAGTLAGSSGTLTCNYETLANGATRTVTLRATTDSTDCGTISNTANVSAASDANPDNSTSGAQTITVVCPDVHVTKVASDATVTQPGEFEYTILGTNDTAGVAAAGVVIVDDLDDDLTIVAATYDVDPSNSMNDDALCDWDPTDNTVTCEVGTLAGDDGKKDGPDEVRVVIAVAATSLACGEVTNQAAISATNEGTADQTDNLSDSDDETEGAQPVSVTVACPPDVAITKEASVTEVTAGEPFFYTITVTNGASGEATDVEVTDVLPDELNVTEPVTYAVGGTTGNCDAIDPQGQGQTLTCTIDTLAANDGTDGSGPDEAVITITAAVDNSACERNNQVDSVSNQATVEASNEPSDRFTQADNESEVVVVTVNCPDVSVEIEAIDEDISAESSTNPAQYRLTLTAGGTGSSNGVVLNDDLPNGHLWRVTDENGDSTDDLDGCSIDDDANTADSIIEGAGELTCDYGDLLNASTRTLTLTATADLAACGGTESGSISNEVRGNSNNDKKSDNNSADAEIEVFCANLNIDKEARGPDNNRKHQHPGNDVELGDSFHYVIDVKNDGLGAAIGVVITDNLDDSLVIESATFHVDPENQGQNDPGDDPGTCTVGENPDVAGDMNFVACDIGDQLTQFDGNQGGGNQEPDHVRVTIVATPTAASCPVISNQASVTGENEPSGLTDDNVSDADPGQGGEHAGAQPWLVGVDCNSLVVSKTPDGDAINAGDAATFTIDVVNQADVVAGDVVLIDELPQLTGGGEWTLGDTTFDDCALETESTTGVQTLTCEDDSIGAETEDEADLTDVRTVTVSAPTTADDCGSILNEDTDMEVTTSRGDTVIADGGEIVVECPDLTVSKTATDTTVDAGEDIEFSISATNIAAGDGYGVVISDTLPAISGTWTVSGDSADACEIVDNELTCSFETLAGDDGQGDGVAGILVTGTTGEADCGDVENTASIAASNEPQDELTQSDNTSTALVTVTCPDDETPPPAAPEPTGGELGGTGTPRPTPAGRTSPNTALPLPGADLIGLAALIVGTSMWAIGRGVIGDRRRRSI